MVNLLTLQDSGCLQLQDGVLTFILPIKLQIYKNLQLKKEHI